MKFTLVWQPSAFNDLATIWTDAPSDQREVIRRAFDAIERRLIRDPLLVGESRSEDRRIVVELPVVIVFDVRPDDRLVRVLAIRLLPSN